MTKPHKHNSGWFSKGRSGNPGGRPRNALPKQRDLEILFVRTFTLAGDGMERQIGPEEALQRRILRDAFKGKRPAIRKGIGWIKERDEWLIKHAPLVKQTKNNVTFTYDSDSADEALKVLGIVTRHPFFDDEDEQLTHSIGGKVWSALSPWVVQLGLKHRRGLKRLTRNEREDIVRCSIHDTSWSLPRECMDGK